MRRDVYEQFDADVERYGGYQYTSSARQSSLRANRRFSNVIIQTTHLDGKRVVDVGCGDGMYTAVLRAETQAASILGIDPAVRAIDHANRTYVPRYSDLEFRHCFAADLVEAGLRFDVAIYRGVIHHVGDPAGEIATALRLAARVFFLEPNGWNPVLKLLERFSPYHREHQERSYRLGQYRRWIEVGGGQVELSFYFGLVPMFCPDWFVPVASALEPIVERLRGLRRFACGQVAILASALAGAPG